jgi:hypothetical protein
LHVCLTHRPDNSHENREATTVVTDAGAAKYRALALHLDIGTFGENGVQVGGNHEARSARRTRSIAAHVSGGIDVHIPKTQTLESLPEQLATSAFLETWRRYFANPYLIVDRLLFSSLRRLHRGLD